MSKRGTIRVVGVILGIIVALIAVAFIGTGKANTITGYQLLAKADYCDEIFAKYDITCDTTLKDVIQFCKTTKFVQSCGSEDKCRERIINSCSVQQE